MALRAWIGNRIVRLGARVRGSQKIVLVVDIPALAEANRNYNRRLA